MKCCCQNVVLFFLFKFNACLNLANVCTKYIFNNLMIFLYTINYYLILIKKIKMLINKYVRFVYDYCTSVNQNSNRQGPGTSHIRMSSAKNRSQNNGTQLVGLELYKKIKAYIQNRMVQIAHVSYIRNYSLSCS